MANSLSVTPATGNQVSTQSPQAASGAGNTSGLTSSFQPASTATTLDGGSGIPLQVNNLPTVSLPGVTTSSQAVVPPAKHHVNVALFAFSGLLFLIAVVLFWSMTRSAKNTTY